MNDEIRGRVQAIRALGANFDLDTVGKTFAIVQGLHQPDPAVTIAADISYAGHERQCLDIYHIESAEKNSPVILFVPGGGFDGGDKRPTDTHFANIGTWFAKRGVVCAIMNYRLAPEFTWPSGAQDVRSAITWLHENAERFGGSADQVWLFGHSAGANHVATALLDRSLGEEPAVCGAILVSGGVYEMASTIDVPPGVHAYFGRDESRFEERSVQNWIDRGTLPIMLGYAELEPAWLAAPSLKFAAALTEREGRAVPVLWLKGHNHISPVLAFGLEGEVLGPEILDFIGHTDSPREGGTQA